MSNFPQRPNFPQNFLDCGNPVERKHEVDIRGDDTQSRRNESSRVEAQLRHRIIITSTNVLYTFGGIKRRRRREMCSRDRGRGRWNFYIPSRQSFRAYARRLSIQLFHESNTRRPLAKFEPARESLGVRDWWTVAAVYRTRNDIRSMCATGYAPWPRRVRLIDPIKMSQSFA